MAFDGVDSLSAEHAPALHTATSARDGLNDNKDIIIAPIKIIFDFILFNLLFFRMKNHQSFGGQEVGNNCWNCVAYLYIPRTLLTE